MNRDLFRRIERLEARVDTRYEPLLAYSKIILATDVATDAAHMAKRFPNGHDPNTEWPVFAEEEENLRP